MLDKVNWPIRPRLDILRGRIYLIGLAAWLAYTVVMPAM